MSTKHKNSQVVKDDFEFKEHEEGIRHKFKPY